MHLSYPEDKSPFASPRNKGNQIKKSKAQATRRIRVSRWGKAKATKITTVQVPNGGLALFMVIQILTSGYVTADGELRRMIFDYFSNLYNSEGCKNFNHIISVVPKLVSGSMNNILMLPIFKAEVKIVIFSLRPSKTAGLGGILGCTVQDCSSLKGILNAYCYASGQLINLNKLGLIVIENCPPDLGTRMLAIPLPRSLTCDCLIWQFEKNGKYSVKPGCKVMSSKKLPKVYKSTCPYFSVPKRLWRIIWNVQVLPKVKKFLWQCNAKALLVNLALWKKKCVVLPVCSICSSDVEMIERLLLLCPWMIEDRGVEDRIAC
ncbi:hypothetical protein LguiB_005973 [Lonicera macranthoides]